MISKELLWRCLVVGSLSGCLAHAAPITWSAPVAPATAADTLTEGTLVYAQNSADAISATINGIEFAATTGPGGSDADGGFEVPDTGDAGLNELLSSHTYQGGGFSFDITGLTVGVIYKVQIWTVGDNRTCCAGREQQYGDGEVAENLSASVRRDSGAAIIGEFLSSSTTQTITVSGATDPGFSGIQVRAVGTADDSDGDGLPDLWEQNIIDFDDADAVAGLGDVKGPNDGTTSDFDSDLLTDADEFANGTDATDDDSDDDTLNDGSEVHTHSTNPLLADSDDDGIDDAEEVVEGSDGYITNPNLADTDGDGYDDPIEVSFGTDPTNINDKPFLTATSELGNGTTALLGGDLTDPENDGVDTENTSGTNFNWVDITASSKPYFSDATAGGVNEGAFDIFDNKVNGGEAKWCCDPGPQDVTVEFSGPTSLTHFTVASGGDADYRDPRIWGIYGSNDGLDFVPIYTRSDAPGTAIWTTRNQVIRFDLPLPSLPYKFIRYQVEAMKNSTTQHQLNEIEYFGVTDPADTDGGGLTDIYEAAIGLNPDDPADDVADLDGDDLINLDEAANGTNPQGRDTDNDGLSDGEEINTYSTDPLFPDTDGDGLTDGEEVNTYKTEPLDVDTDYDTLSDGEEVTEGADGFITDPNEPDTDSDGVDDDVDLDPLADNDNDNDGLNNLAETTTHNTDPLDPDSDGDEIFDGDEIKTYLTDPNLFDTDEDGWGDGIEVAEGTDPKLDTSFPVLTKITDSFGLLGADITDPEDDGVESATPWMTGWAFADINSTGTGISGPENYFGGVDGNPGEGAWDIFDNQVGGGSNKWCCDPAPQAVELRFAASFSLTHFTVTSGNDSPDRDPAVWSIQGSSDGVVWENIYPAPGTNDEDHVSAPWTFRDQTLRFDLPEPSAKYTHFRYKVDQVRGPDFSLHQLGEIELFGTREDIDTDGGGVPDWYENLYDSMDPGNAADDDLDSDGDGLTNEEEFLGVGTNPELADTDGDGVDDDEELAAGSNPLDINDLPILPISNLRIERTGSTSWELTWDGGDGTNDIESSTTGAEGTWFTEPEWQDVSSPFTVTADPEEDPVRLYRVFEFTP